MAKSESTDLAAEARTAFERVSTSSAEVENRKTYVDDQAFTLEEKQWPADIRKTREAEGRPVLTINKLKTFGRQVINDSRQNKPSVKVNPVDSDADPETAEIFNGLIRNIQNASDADVAYDTAIECAVWGGFGYWRIVLDYAYDDSFDMDIRFKRVANPLTVYGDPNSTEADSSDWDEAFVTDRLTKKQFEAQYKGKANTDFDSGAWTDAGEAWRTEDDVMVAEWWSREKFDKPIYLLSDGMVIGKEEFEANDDLLALKDEGVLQIVDQRMTKSCKVTQRIMSGAECLKENKWLGKYIPIVPVYGEEFNIGGKRIFRSLIHSALDSQRTFNYWRTVAAEVAGYTPRVPFIGPVGSFASDDRWATANTKSHAFLEYDPVPGQPPPQRQPLDMGVAAGALQEALNASDDMKAVIGMYDASLGARSNETSGKAINARKMEGDVATFHFGDNLTRAIRHTGRILIDLIPKIYDKPRIVRVLGEDGKPRMVPLQQEVPAVDAKGQPQTDEQGQPMTRVYDITVGKYDLTVAAGPSFTTKREEAVAGMTEAVRAYPEGAPILIPLIAKNSDWAGADEVAEKFEAMNAPAQVPPEVQQQIEEGQKLIEQQAAEIEQLKSDQTAEIAKVESTKAIKAIELDADMETERLKIESAERLEMIKIASNEKIALAKAASDAKIASERNAQQAKAMADRPQPRSANGAG